MKVKISFTATINDVERLAINHHYGLEGKATHQTARDFLQDNLDMDEAVKNFYAFKAKRYGELAAE